MSKINDGGAAFPSLTIVPLGGGMAGPHPGMSLRDWFAGQALAGYFARTQMHMNAASPDAAEYCYAMADLMLAARAKAPEA